MTWSERAFRFVTVAAVMGFLTLTACSERTVATTDPAQLELLDRVFVSTEVLGDPIPGGGPLTVEITAPDQITATAGCNQMVTTGDFLDGTLTAGPLATTMMMCPADLGAADLWLSGLLEARPRWNLAGDTLTLRTDVAVVTLVDAQAVNPNLEFSETVWVVEATISPAAVTASQAIETSMPTIRPDGDDTVTVSAGCNMFSGTARIDGDAVTFDFVSTTLHICDPDIAEVEQAVLTALDGTVTAIRTADRMRLINPNGYGLYLSAQR